jgi:hypothetical protein
MYFLDTPFDRILQKKLFIHFESEAGFGVNVGATVRVEIFATLRCTFEGHPTRTLHFIARPKPWEKSHAAPRQGARNAFDPAVFTFLPD